VLWLSHQAHWMAARIVKRREFITFDWCGLGWDARCGRAPRRAGPIPVIGFLNSASPQAVPANSFAAFHKGLNEQGYVEGRNVKNRIPLGGKGEEDRLKPAGGGRLVCRGR